METTLEKYKRELYEIRIESFKQGYWKGQEDAKVGKWDNLKDGDKI